jgi:flagellar M-ring protein FliF
MAAQNLVASGSGEGEAKSTVSGLGGIEQIPGLRQLLLLVGLAAAVAVGVGVALWSSEDTSYGVLYSNLGDGDAAAVVQALEAAGIEHRYEPARGAILVPDGALHDARLQLASQDLPAGAGTGFEMFNDGGGLTDSQFMESARYQRALEVELQRTVASISAVRSARVHLAMPRDSVFVRERRPASASVLVQLHPGRRLEPGQVIAVVNLVASSVPDMERSQVAVIDQQGTLLSADLADTADPTSEALDRVERIEERLSRRIEELLTPIVGYGRVRAQVAADIDLSRTEETQERFDPEGQVIRSEQGSERSGDSAAAAAGVPGALSNQPPGEGVPEDAGDETAAADEVTDREFVRNYEVDRTIRHILAPAGQIRRLSVAVVVDEPRVTNDDGEVETRPYSAEELERMTTLVREAVGFNEARGDTVSVVSAAFRGAELGEGATVDEPSLLDRIDLMGLTRIAAGVIVLLLLIMAVIRPLLRQLMQAPAGQTRVVERAPQSLAYEGAEQGESGQGDARSLVKDPRQQYEERIAAAKSAVAQDPKQVAQVVKQWVNEDE